MNIQHIVDKAYAEMSFTQIADASVEALKGVSARDAQMLKEAFNVETVRDLADLKFVKWAAALVTLTNQEIAPGGGGGRGARGGGAGGGAGPAGEPGAGAASRAR